MYDGREDMNINISVRNGKEDRLINIRVLVLEGREYRFTK